MEKRLVLKSHAPMRPSEEFELIVDRTWKPGFTFGAYRARVPALGIQCVGYSENEVRMRARELVANYLWKQAQHHMHHGEN